ncbi:dentin sialophosphoprotein-like isoform X2 [Littorina saxatilis]|uniref:Uncharacterized protein n=1 Tax=Littorina saxatilis TaxID=31220 RepID=A0AAN9BYE3_9CAEN
MKEGGNQFASPVFKKRFARRKTTNRPFTFARNFDAEAISAAAQNRIIEQVGDRGVVITSPVRLPKNNERLSITDIVRQSPVPVLIAHTSPKAKQADITNHGEDDEEFDTSLVRRSGRSREPSDSFLSRRQYPHGTPQHSKHHRLPDDSYIGSQNSSNIDAEVSFTEQSTKRGRKRAGALPGSSKRSKKASIQQNSNALDTSTGSSKENHKASIQQSSNALDTSTGSSKENHKASIQQSSNALDTSTGSSKENHKASIQQSSNALDTSTGSSKENHKASIQQNANALDTSTGSSKENHKASIQQNSNALDTSTGSSKENHKASTAQPASSGSRKGSRKANTQQNSKALNTSEGSSKENHEASSAQPASSASSKRSKKGNSQQSFHAQNTSTASSKKSQESDSAQPASPGPSNRSKKGNRKQNSIDLNTSAGSSKENHEASTAQDASSRSSKRSKEPSAQQSSTALHTSAGNSKEKHEASTAQGVTTSVVRSSSRKHPAGKPIAQSSGRRRKEKEQPVQEKTPSPSPAKTAGSNNGRKEKQSVSAEALKESFSTAKNSDDLSDLRSSRRNKIQSRQNARSTSKGENKSEAELSKASGLPSGSEKRRKVVTATLAISKSGQKRKSPDADMSAEHNNSSHIKIGRRGVKTSTPSREGNESVLTNSVNRRKQIDSSPVSAVSSSPSGGMKRAAVCSGDEDLEALGSSPQKRGRNNHSSGAMTSSPRKQSQNKRQASHSQNTSNNSSGIASSASGARKRSDSSSDDEIPEALAPSPQKKGRNNPLSGTMTSSPPKQSQNKTQATKNTWKIISARKPALANSNTENSSALKNKGTRSKSNANVDTSVPEKHISSQSKQKATSSTKRFFKDQERSPQKVVVNEIVCVRASPRTGVPKSAHSSWKTSERVSSQLQPKRQPSNVSVSTVCDDVTFGGEVSGTKEATRGRKVPHTRHRQAQDGSYSAEDNTEWKGGRKVVTELDVIINKLDETESDIMEKSNMTRACRSGVHKAFTFTKRQLQETVSQLTEIQEMSSRVNKLKYQCKAMSEEMKENHSQKCHLLQELRSLGDRGVDADLVRIDEWLQDFQALQEAV